MNALISPMEEIRVITSWDMTNPANPNAIYGAVGVRVADTAEVPFEVAAPLYWVPCADDVVRDLFYYDPVDSTIKATPTDAPMPVNPNQPQPVVSGMQSV